MQRSDEEKSSTSPRRRARDTSAAVGAVDESGRGASGSGSGRGRLGRAFSPRSFAAVLALSVCGLLLGGAIPLIGFVGQFVGLFAVAFGVGLLSSRRRYLEVGLAGALASGLGFVLGTLTATLFAVGFLAEYGVAVAGIGAGAGLLASLAGHHFGRDLRDGLTREL
jgi:hypothetical protein